MKRLLAISWEMPPMYGPRATQVARLLGALSPLGWRSVVVCMAPRRGGPHWRDGVDVAVPEGIETVRVASPEERTVLRAARRLLPSLRNSPDPQSVWIEPAASAALTEVASRRPAGIVSFAQPWSDHVIALRVHAASKLPWVAHFSDPWVDSPYLRASARQRAEAAKLEEQVIHQAAAVVFVTDETADLVMDKYPRAWRDKVAVVPHGFIPAAISAARVSPTGPLRIVYTGRFYDGVRTPTTLLRALARLNRRMPLAGVLDVSFVGPHVVQFSRESTALGLDGVVRWSDRVSPTDAHAMAAEADVLLVIDAPSVGPSPFLPSKLVDYLPLQKLVLGITPSNGATSRVLERLGCPTAPPEDVERITELIEELLRRKREGVLGIGPQFAAVAGEFDIRQTAARFSSVLTRTFDVARAESA